METLTKTRGRGRMEIILHILQLLVLSAYWVLPHY
uniref:Macaca fascicularis brain cDNA, clone: QflA-17353 n=1 Tax=Macaca fascicularis TaxID=9541 RepID=I7GAM3_MACFA|nr:unnamed protein product [Macaca fascicularis]